jgi:hypothetical protein
MTRRRLVCLVAAGTALVLGGIHDVFFLSTLGSLSLDPHQSVVATFVNAALFYKLEALAPLAVALGALLAVTLHRSLVGGLILWTATVFYVVVFVGGFIALLPPAPVPSDEWTTLPFDAYAGSALASVVAGIAAIPRRAHGTRPAPS